MQFKMSKELDRTQNGKSSKEVRKFGNRHTICSSRTHIFIFVFDDRDALAVVPNFDLVGLCIDGDLDATHIRIADFVVRRVDQNFIEDLVQTGDVGDFTLKAMEEESVRRIHNFIFFSYILFWAAVLKGNKSCKTQETPYS